MKTITAVILALSLTACASKPPAPTAPTHAGRDYAQGNINNYHGTAGATCYPGNFGRRICFWNH